ncbi:hypothetical protein ACTRXD_15255 [Nitrospira sp. T9]|uniref:hypothetical protein n=1 Tax=unclassified Nitrospira TaxID=2652172 RepID=UPI003F944E7A
MPQKRSELPMQTGGILSRLLLVLVLLFSSGCAIMSKPDTGNVAVSSNQGLVQAAFDL